MNMKKWGGEEKYICSISSSNMLIKKSETATVISNFLCRYYIFIK